MLTKSKRILIFSLSYVPLVGGAEVAVKEITDRVNDIEFDMITLRFSRKHPKFERIGNVNVYRIGGGFGYLSKILFVPMSSLWAIRRKYDAYWAIMTNMLFPVTMTHMLGSHTPYVLTLQDGDPFEHVFERLRIKVFLPLLKYGFSHANKVQSISNFLGQWAISLGYKGEVEIVPNGVDIERFNITDISKEDSGKTVLITTSRLVKKNAVGDIIKALGFLPESYVLKILGSGPLELELKTLTKRLNLESRVEFLGTVSQADIPKYLYQSDIFVRPSLSEGQGVSFIEAMAAGLPVIATPVGGIVDFLKDGETGLFCEVNNPKSIATQAERVTSDSALRKRLIDNAKGMVRSKYDWNIISKQMEDKVFAKI